MGRTALAEPGPLAASSEEVAVLALLDDVPVSPDQLIAHGVDAGQMAMLLVGLEVKGWVRRAPGGYSLSTAGARVRAAEDSTHSPD